MKFYEIKQNLLEARADYLNLFNPLITVAKNNNISALTETIVKNEIDKARRETGTRYNYMMYYLKMYRAFLANQLLPRVSDDGDRKKLKKMIDIAPKYDKSGNVSRSNLDRVLVNFKHFLSYNYKPIEDYVPAKSYDEVFDDLDNLETQYHEMNVDDESRFLRLQDGDKIFKEYPDGFVWVMLNRAACREEADAMGHCGNVPSQKSGERILSLRRKEVRDGELYYIPYLTFIYNTQSKLLGERKARFNEKPSKRYHPYILDLLRMDMIQGMEPESNQYSPENNFQYDDLGTEQREKLFKEKPILGITDGVRLSEFSDDMKDVVENRISSSNTDCAIYYDKDKNKIFTTIYTERLIGDNLLKFFSDPYSYTNFSHYHDNEYLSNFSELNVKNIERLYKAIKKVYDGSDHDKEDFDDFPEFPEFTRKISRGGLVDMIEEVGLEDDSDIDDILSNLKSMLGYTAESEYESYMLSKLMTNMPELDGEKFTLFFVGFANKQFKKNREIFDYYSEESYYAVYETDRMIVDSDTIDDLVGDVDKLKEIHDDYWYPSFTTLNDYFSDYFEHDVKED
jgi:hypothetical protein